MTGVVSACDTYAVESDNLEFIFENWLQKFEPGGFGELKGEYMYSDMVSRWKRVLLYYIGSKTNLRTRRHHSWRQEPCGSQMNNL